MSSRLRRPSLPSLARLSYRRHLLGALRGRPLRSMRWAGTVALAFAIGVLSTAPGAGAQSGVANPLAAPIGQWLPDTSFGVGGAIAVPANGGRAQFVRAGQQWFSSTGIGDGRIALSSVDAAGQVGSPVTLPAPNGEVAPAAVDGASRLYFVAKSGSSPLAPGFGRDGLTRFDGATGARDEAFSPEITSARRPSVLAVAGQGDLVIVAVGRQRATDATNGVIVRVATDGSVDTAFGSGGEIATPTEAASCLVVRPDGSFAASYASRIASFDSSGQPEPGFGSGGSVSVAQRRGEECPLLMADGALVVARSQSRSRAITALTRVSRDGRLDTHRLSSRDGVAMSGLIARAGGGLLVAGNGPPAALAASVGMDPGQMRVRALNDRLRSASVAGRSAVFVPRYAPLGTSGFGNTLEPLILSDGQRALVPLRSLNARVQYARVAFGDAARSNSTAVGRPKLRLRLFTTRTDQLAVATYVCGLSCRVARVDADVVVDGARRKGLPFLTDTTGGTFAYERETARRRAVVVGTGFPIRVSRRLRPGDSVRRTVSVVMRVRVTDGFGRSTGTSLGYRARCTVAVDQNRVSRYACSRRGNVTSRVLP